MKEQTAGWLEQFRPLLESAFAGRIRFLGLQGSRRREEERPGSDLDVVLVLDHKIVSSPDDQQINFHPCVNTATIALSIGDFKRVLARFGNRIVEEQFEGQLDKVAPVEA